MEADVTPRLYNGAGYSAMMTRLSVRSGDLGLETAVVEGRETHLRQRHLSKQGRCDPDDFTDLDWLATDRELFAQF